MDYLEPTLEKKLKKLKFAIIVFLKFHILRNNSLKDHAGRLIFGPDMANNSAMKHSFCFFGLISGVFFGGIPQIFGQMVENVQNIKK